MGHPEAEPRFFELEIVGGGRDRCGVGDDPRYAVGPRIFSLSPAYWEAVTGGPDSFEGTVEEILDWLWAQQLKESDGLFVPRILARVIELEAPQPGAEPLGSEVELWDYVIGSCLGKAPENLPEGLRGNLRQRPVVRGLWARVRNRLRRS